MSGLGSQVTRVALPLAAVSVLHATPLQMGVLRALAAAPDFAFGLMAGAGVDRVRRRPLLIATDLGRALVVGSVPAAALLDVLGMQQLYAVAFASAALALTFDVAAQAYLPGLVGSDELAAANSGLAFSGSLGSLTGPALGGALVQLLTAPVAMAVDGLSFVLSALALWLVGAREPDVARPRERAGPRAVLASAVEGARFLLRDRELLPLAVAAGLFNLFDGVIFAVYVLYATRELGIPAVLLGTIIAAGGAGGLAGAVLAGAVGRRLGPRRAAPVGLLVATAGELLIAFASGPVGVAAGLLLVAEVLVGLGAAVFSITYLTLRQLATPPAMQGRVHAASRTISTGLVPVGALLGGVLGTAVGLRAPLIAGAAGTLLAAAPLLATGATARGRP